MLLFRPSPRFFEQWRCFLLRVFGAKIGKRVNVATSAIVWYPPNLTLHNDVVIGPAVDLYCVAPIEIGANSIVSQYSYLCSGSHDYRQESMPLISKPISVGERTWVCARAFVGPGVSVGNFCVVGACAVVVKDVEDRCIVVGNPAKVIKKTEFEETEVN